MIRYFCVVIEKDLSKGTNRRFNKGHTDSKYFSQLTRFRHTGCVMVRTYIKIQNIIAVIFLEFS